MLTTISLLLLMIMIIDYLSYLIKWWRPMPCAAPSHWDQKHCCPQLLNSNAGRVLRGHTLAATKRSAGSLLS
ncbi:hypothetical protein BGW36DRAFT_378474 [Talaromyces proteolyticus]|uniref:Uncharacterized protein n=1 Tax=Talaromyces proteolyticus TaxID=1131652 RepID=A0AAD4Q0K0_9EURO|nr:uncharacterized protein BGW36DRAFT_378474 [Talaromyces proteolyticus]KAH8697336.1 hypothetical protein BGW36DRAFT_378474 [Talaromyces proteolyticus]